MDRGYDIAWLLAATILFGLFLIWTMRRRNRAVERDAEGEEIPVGPDDFTRARIQFFMALALLVVIIVIAVLTHLQ